MAYKNNNEHPYEREDDFEPDMYMEEYIRGYNEGYMISRFEPELLKDLYEVQGKLIGNSYIEGLNNGKEQYEREKINARLKEINLSNEKNRDRGR